MVLYNREEEYFMRIVVQAWMTLDGVFDASTFGEWFNNYHSDERAAHIQDNVLGCDALLMGANTYRTLAPYWSSLRNNEMGIADKMNAAPKYLVSKSSPELTWDNTRPVVADNIVAQVTQLKRESGGYFLLPGSAMLVDELLDAHLIDEFRLLVHPVVLGYGQRFFSQGKTVSELRLDSSETLPFGVLALTYSPVGSTAATARLREKNAEGD